MVKMRVATSVLGDKRVGRFVNLVTLDSKTTIQEAIDMHYVTGKASVIEGLVKAVFKAMSDGIKKDGKGRAIDEYVSINAFPKGGYMADACDELDRSTLKVNLRAKMLKQFMVPAEDWSYIFGNEVINFLLESITTGEVLGEIVLGEDVFINGRDIELADGDTVSYRIPDTGVEGTFEASDLTSDATRITVPKELLADLVTEDNDGLRIDWAVKIGNRTAQKSATLKYIG